MVTRVDCLVPIHCVADPALIAYNILTSPHYIYISAYMNFLKKILGFEQDITQRMGAFKAKGTLFEVAGTTRNIKYFDCDSDSRSAP